MAAARAGDRAALARLLSLIEQGGEPARAVGRLSHPLGGAVYTVGITGAPGSGKSTLTSELITTMRRQSLDVAVLAIDPSSPFSGGAILGDRVRMQDHATDAGVFIRSMATRGHLGAWRWRCPKRCGCSTHSTVSGAHRDRRCRQVESRWRGRRTPPSSASIRAGATACRRQGGLMEIADVFCNQQADRKGVEKRVAISRSCWSSPNWATGGLRSCRGRDERRGGRGALECHRRTSPPRREFWPARAPAHSTPARRAARHRCPPLEIGAAAVHRHHMGRTRGRRGGAGSIRGPPPTACSTASPTDRYSVGA